MVLEAPVRSQRKKSFWVMKVAYTQGLH